jgi:hypothetical protein
MSETLAKTVLAKVIHLGTVDANPLQAGAAEYWEVVINRGARDGVKVGDNFLIFGYGPDLADPETGEELGTLEVVRGRGLVIHVQDRVATLRSTEKRRRRGRTKRVREVRRSAIAGVFGPETVVEEEIPEDEDVPFADIKVGDLARPV